jgi:hypothetical protein
MSRVFGAVGSMFEVSFDGTDVVIWPRFRDGYVQIPVAAISHVEIRMPKPLASGGLRFTVPGDVDVDGIKVDFFGGQREAFCQLHDALLRAISETGRDSSAAAHSGDLTVLNSLRQVGSLSDLEFGVRRNELLADELTLA